MSKFKSFVIFSFGAAIGSAVTWKYLKDTYEQLAQEEINAVKEVYTRKEKNETIKVDTKPNMKNNSEMMEYATKLNKEKHMDYSHGSAVEESENQEVDKPYVISPGEFGELGDEYTRISLSYYTDGILADENDEIIEDVDEIVGEDFADHFGEYEPDSVFVRNDRLKCDYEILIDQRNYSEVVKSKPHHVEVQ